MRTSYDLRIPDDRRVVGRILAPLISLFNTDTGRAIPQGGIWEALEDVRRHLEQSYLDSRETQAGVFARMLAKLTGGQPRQASLTAEDYARLDGRREALRDFLLEVSVLALEASRLDAEEMAAKNRRPERGNGFGRTPGASPM